MADAKPRKLWDYYQVLYEVRKAENKKFVIAAAVKDGFKFVTIREWYLKKTTGEWKPGSDGIAVPVVMPFSKKEARLTGKLQVIRPLATLVSVLVKVLAFTDTMPLEDKDKELWYIPKTDTTPARVTTRAELEEMKNENQ